MAKDLDLSYFPILITDTVTPAEDNQVLILSILTRGVSKPFTRSDWDGWNGAMGAAHSVEFTPQDQTLLMKALGIQHWGENVFFVIDDEGFTANGWDNRAYAYQVSLKLVTTEVDRDLVEPDLPDNGLEA